MTDLQGTAFAVLIVSHGMVLLCGHRFGEQSDISAWMLLIGGIVLALCGFSLLVGGAV